MVLLLGISNSKARKFWESVLLLRLDIWTQETNWGGEVGGLKVWPGVPLAKWLNCHTVELQNFWVERDFQVSSSRSEILCFFLSGYFHFQPRGVCRLQLHSRRGARRIIRDRATQQTDTLAEIPLGRKGLWGDRCSPGRCSAASPYNTITRWVKQEHLESYSHIKHMFLNIERAYIAGCCCLFVSFVFKAGSCYGTQADPSPSYVCIAMPGLERDI